MKEIQHIIDDTDLKPLLPYLPFSFDHPIFIVFSSGTTGKPKAIIHRAGGVLLQQKKELLLHCDLKPKDRLFYFTTCSWMMWHWMLTGLSGQACIITYEGSPFFPNKYSFLNLIEEEKIHIFGASPRYLSALKETKLKHSKDFESLKTLLLTGAPVYAEHYLFAYEFFKKDLHIISLSGGTDILGCFMIGNPLKPVIPGKIQGPSLGMDIASFDPDGKPMIDHPGELVCLKPFPSQPIGFLNDRKKEQYKKSYFDFFPNIWRHGDSITIDSKGMIEVHGRSDGTLNPSGVRIGTSEIYSVLEKNPIIQDSICIGWFDQKVKDERIILFVTLKKNIIQTNNLSKDISSFISESLTLRHKPYKIFFISSIPYTQNQKKMEVPLKKFFAGFSEKEANLMIDKNVLDELTYIKSNLLNE